MRGYSVLAPVSRGYPKAKGRLLTCYSPVRRSSTPKGLSARLACVKHAASVRPEPGSNSPLSVYRGYQLGRAGLGGSRRLEEMSPASGKPGLGDDLAYTVQDPDRTVRVPHDGVCANALAFSTLLSSQGADANRPELLNSVRGNPANLPACLMTVKVGSGFRCV